MSTSDLERLFPKLQAGGYSVTSPATRSHNCIAWAAGVTDRWWWPDRSSIGYWPAEAPREETLAAFIAAFESLGYVRSDSQQGDSLDPDREKVAIFAKEGTPTHAARQLPSGRWTSKCGKSEDIEHALADLEGDAYGTVAVILLRPRQEQLA